MEELEESSFEDIGWVKDEANDEDGKGRGNVAKSEVEAKCSSKIASWKMERFPAIGFKACRP